MPRQLLTIATNVSESSEGVEGGSRRAGPPSSSRSRSPRRSRGGGDSGARWCDRQRKGRALGSPGDCPYQDVEPAEVSDDVGDEPRDTPALAEVDGEAASLPAGRADPSTTASTPEAFTSTTAIRAPSSAKRRGRAPMPLAARSRARPCRRSIARVD